MNILITENQFNTIITENYITYKSLNQSQRNKIKDSGRKIFNLIKSNIDNDILRQYSLVLKVPSVEFLDKNIEDITFAITNLELSPSQKNKLLQSRNEIEMQKENLKKEDVLLFFELNDEGGDNEWSFANMFDNNITLWLKLMKHSLKIKDFESLDDAIDFYFSKQDNGEILAHNDLMTAILTDRDIHISKVFNKTWGNGVKTENRFFDSLSQLTKVKVFSEPGNYVDRTGIDGAFYCKKINKWIPVQVKSDKQDALDSIPKGGVSVYYIGSKFHYVSERRPEGGLFRTVINNCIEE